MKTKKDTAIANYKSALADLKTILAKQEWNHIKSGEFRTTHNIAAASLVILVRSNILLRRKAQIGLKGWNYEYKSTPKLLHLSPQTWQKILHEYNLTKRVHEKAGADQNNEELLGTTLNQEHPPVQAQRKENLIENLFDAFKAITVANSEQEVELRSQGYDVSRLVPKVEVFIHDLIVEAKLRLAISAMPQGTLQALFLISAKLLRDNIVTDSSTYDLQKLFMWLTGLTDYHYTYPKLVNEIASEFERKSPQNQHA